MSEPLATALPLEELAAESFISTSAMVSSVVRCIGLGGMLEGGVEDGMVERTLGETGVVKRRQLKRDRLGLGNLGDGQSQ